MNSTKRIGGIIKPILFGLIFFTGLVGLSQGVVALNASLSPAIPWFPLPALLICYVAIRWLNGRQELRLARPVSGTLHAITLLLTLAVLCLGVFENWFYELTLPSPSFPNAAVSDSFQLVFVFVFPFIAAVLAEIAFRGQIQTALEKVLPLWPVLVLIAVLNFLMHFYDPEQLRQLVRLLALNLVWGYMTWYSKSLRPALLAHVLMNVSTPMLQLWAERFGGGPADFGAFTPVGLTVVAVTGLASVMAGLWLLKAAEKPAAEA